MPNADRVAAFGDPQYALAFARIECHYFQNRGFFDRDDYLLAHAGRLSGIPGVIVHGRYDLCTPIETAWALHQAWPEADYRPVDDAGHAMTEPGIVHELISATERFKHRPA
jgi:proline iminopeptidase